MEPMYEAKTFNIPSLDGISSQTIEEHLGLYNGYVKNLNHILDSLKQVVDPYAKREMQRRMGFEFGGMRNHEYYFAQFEEGSKSLPPGKLKELIEEQYDNVDSFVDSFKEIASTRGVGWVIAYIDKSVNKLVMTWVDEQHLGQLVDVDMVLALDMWEHSYMLDYPPSKKKDYIEAFFRNLNWEVVAGRV